jgi:hypothetical protein
MALYSQGLPLRQIRALVDEKWGRYNLPATNTPLPEE